MSYYINSFIVLIKKKLGFSRHAIGKKCFSIKTFPENVFVYLFKNEEKFKYSPAKHKYQCFFEGFAGAAKLKEIFHYDHWNFRQNPFTNTKGYVLLENYENTYQVKFINEKQIATLNNQKSPEESIKEKFHYILPQLPLQNINQYHWSKSFL
ncbi:hypothetical protein GLOIN_2v1785691 [Rhizophagus irregularis DAOM 181602=DAOM 197198]|uniref:Uncharacterized protein n=1 Tax=Rhizophagus irregularis (strain DAOM 181602 / DAOM 197198 / MUCL 43194) TaxID=747089 RepID=A0A2P4P9S2_RHIID|nr:hypothetical protein GLOIN_2v1785691 [Rhizophagus irregularis DAOM 181602=DAOM 197198]POG62135.1 hypothetical protein GLOIN_2v1785691 [Rhizophagus irregularis DAOM 181602=DAOM 197198]|eukprot:XP_025169001.1 hypothetical protein GLOIN_2v1785691 [Rhizophagus irregularis DAOM 181602=DAOM 197198]